MRFLIGMAIAVAAFAVNAKDDPAQVKREVAQHLAIAKAHEAAAKCKESGKDEEVCHSELAKACKGIAIGKFCGMKHTHEN